MDKARRGLETAKAKMLSGKFDLIVLDEILVSIHFGLFNDEEVMTFMKMKPINVELILTGRYCPDKILEAADLVTEMKVIKHYYQEGVLARKGIES
jgi:cob(I)alamin adenosyltransferase